MDNIKEYVEAKIKDEIIDNNELLRPLIEDNLYEYCKSRISNFTPI